MKLALAAMVAAASLVAVTADCPNACSGNGQCSTNHDFCKCYEGFTGADCSLRVCPFAPAFIDLPQGDLTHDNKLDSGGADHTAAVQPSGILTGSALNPDFRPQGFWERHPSQLYGTADQVATLTMAVREDEGHFMSECAGVGLCDRSSGQCSCFPGFGGTACNRTVCPNDCSGHGICRSVAETLPKDIEWYRLWEASKHMRCQCDAGFTGLDCGSRECPRGDDPLTTMTTRAEYNKGLTETSEVQHVDVRCKFGGTAINPLVSITYTDPDTSNRYNTPYFDLSTATASEVEAMLKALPNDVLADYTVDGVRISNRLQSVSISALETSKFWRVAITFNSALGDVAPVEVVAHPNFLCKNALDVDTSLGGFETFENVAVSAIGDGPSKKLLFKVHVRLDASTGGDDPDVFNYTVYGDNFTPLASDALIPHVMTSSATDAFVFDNAGTFDREAALLQFYFEGGDGTGTTTATDIRSSDFTNPGEFPPNVIYLLTYDPIPAITVSNPTAVLESADAFWRSIRQVNTYANGTRIPVGSFDDGGSTVSADPIWFNRPTDPTPAYDMKVEMRNNMKTRVTVFGAAQTIPVAWARFELLLNNEHVAFIDEQIAITDAGSAFYDLILNKAIYGYRVPEEFKTGVPTIAFTNTSTPGQFQLKANASFVAFTPKTPIVVKSTGVDSIDVAYVDNEAVNQSLTLVLKIVATSSSPDTFAWKFAGDSTFMDNNGAGYPVPSANDNFTKLPDALDYVSDLEDDDARWQALRILLRWNDGNDFDKRVPCGTNGANMYYIQFGTNGLNDRPSCSDRGVCDASSGECSCYAGYTGPECSEQNALARGGGGSSA